MSNSKSIEWGIKELMVVEPFYGLFAIGVHKEFSERVPTACVAADPKLLSFNLFVNPKFWESINDNVKVGIIHHEMLHLAEFHLFVLHEYEDKELANIAMDMRINQYIPKQNQWDKMIQLDSFPPFVFPPFLSSREYYDLLKNAQNQSPSLNGLLNAMKGGKNTPCWHDLWEQVGGGEGDGDGEWGEMSESLRELYKAQIGHQLKEIYENYLNKNQGLVPGNLQEIIKNLYKEIKPIFNWSEIVRRFGSHSIISESKTSRSKLNPRYPDQPAIKIIDRKSMLVGIDTSGSMPTTELSDFLAQVEFLSRMNIDIDLLQCDAAIRDVRTYKRGMDVQIFGRGGTVFDPVIKLLNETKKYNGLVFFTDGAGTRTIIPKKPCLWVISSNGLNDFKAPHYVAKIN